MNSKTVSFFKGEFCIILCAVFWGFISLFSRPLNDMGFSSAEITFVRSVLAVIFLGVFLLIKGKDLFKISPRNLPLLIFLGVGCFMTVCLLYTLSIEKNGSAVAAMLEYTSPIWTVMISRFLFNEKITAVKVISLAGITGGCVLLTVGGNIILTAAGVLIGLLTGLFLSLYGVVSKVACKKYAAETVTFYMFLFSATGAFFAAEGWNVPAKIIADTSCIPSFLGLSALATALAYILYETGLKTVSASKASMISVLEIAVATVVGVVFFNGDAGVWGYAGIAVTVISLIFLETGDRCFKRNKGAEKDNPLLVKKGNL